ncbi:AAA family ATPase [Nonomuraea jabiensis]|uniref:Orc1-like AAA ATPase domain-containing protein n=1 Tax=Nonomuraea jabiensis TaxID=882448 RepID=A0A7W9LFT5_9ACTN|nr:ATP-binding protein [Nonomuraea jabiensis]MBB5782098.1 hypothetical protein [Nonomuraea jabiensis]
MDSATTTLIGREDGQARLSAFMEAAMGQALVVRGEAGIGKSALLDHAADLARQSGPLVIRATGVEAESELPYAGLHQLLHPLLSGAGRPGDGCRAVFDAAFAQHEGRPPSVMALGVAMLGLVSRAAAEQPLLLVLDDGQWLDDPSADVCGFVSRRIAGSPVKLLVAVRADVASRFDMGALPEVAVGALSDDDAARLLDQHHPALGKHARQVVLDQARGNPLTLLELPAHVAGRPGDEPATDASGRPEAPLPRRLQLLYGTRIAALSDTVRAELSMLRVSISSARAAVSYRSL